MHKSAISLFIILSVLAGGCGGSDVVRGKNSSGKLSATDYDRLLQLNRMQQENIDAREYAHDNFTTLGISEKSKAMGSKISSPTCVRNGEIPDNDLNGQVHEQALGGANCPIYWFRRRGWTLANKTMVVADNLEIKDRGYRKDFTDFAVRTMEGSYSVIPDSAGFRVAGTVKITNFQTTAHGRIEGAISVSFRNNNNEGAGSVILNLQGTQWASSASIAWTLRNGAPGSATYRINNAKVEQQQFNDLFSAYELDKYMDNALKMK